MRLEPASVKEIKHIASGIIIGDILAILVCTLFKAFSIRLVLLVLLCSAVTLGGFVWLCFSVQKAVSMGDKARNYLTRTYVGRMILYAVCAVVVVKLGTTYAEMIAGVLPLFYPGLTIKFIYLINGNKKEKEEQ